MADRDEIRTILVAAGAPAHDIEWLVASCPSIDDARTYRPPVYSPDVAAKIAAAVAARRP